jgi:hypothetical protein
VVPGLRARLAALRPAVRRLVTTPIGRGWLGTLLLAAIGGVAAFLIAHRLFPYHSFNHDEAVYLQQAAMLLEGQFVLRPPVVEPFRPWFFVRDGSAIYPKYTPVTAAIFAIGTALGDPRLSLVLVGAAVVGLTTVVGRQTFDTRVGLLAGVFVLCSPLFLVHAGVFLPYAPAAALNLAFAAAYLRADRTGSLRWAAVAGLAIGTAFFARSYTAVLFAAPLVVHALWSLWPAVTSLRPRSLPATLARPIVRRQGLVALGGLAGVAVTLGYNTLLTGDPTTFPYEAFAPRDGLGFGERELLGYERDYTLALALRSNALGLLELVTEWVAAGLVGTVLAAGGAALAALRILAPGAPPRAADPDRAGRKHRYRLLLLGLVASVTLGNVYFWGTLNTLGNLDVPTDGLIATHGPYYHFDLLAPMAIFAGVALLRLGERTREVLHSSVPDRRTRWAVVIGLLLVATSVLGAAAVTTADGPIDRNRQVTHHYEAAYEPVLSRSFENDVVFVPTPYGDWLAHPFQPFRNGPEMNGPVVYALDHQPFRVIDAYPDRRYHRYAYNGEWRPTTGEPVDARLQPVRHVRGDPVRLDATLGIPERTESVSVRLRGADDAVSFVGQPGATARTAARLPVQLRLTDGRAHLGGAIEPIGNRSTVRLPDRGTVLVTVFVQRGVYGFSYRLEVPVEGADTESGTRESAVRALTPRIEVCDRPRRCDGEAAYVPRAAPAGVSANVTLTASGDPAPSAG